MLRHRARLKEGLAIIIVDAIRSMHFCRRYPLTPFIRVPRTTFWYALRKNRSCSIRLEKSGILVRDVSSYPMLENCLRISVGSPGENNALKKALDLYFVWKDWSYFMNRKATISRTTKETDIELSLVIDGSGVSKISSGNGFLDHMLTLFARHGLFDLDVACKGDTEVDFHHSAEDIGICLGMALADALGNCKGITRFGMSYVPMDEVPRARVPRPFGQAEPGVQGRPCRPRHQ